MKDYIDLTQLPAEKVEAMVLALSKNDFDLLRKYCDELGILYGYPMEEVVNIFSDQLLLSKKTLMKAVDQMDPGYLATQVGDIEETLSSKADLSALNPIQQRVADISNENSEINGRIDEISGNISALSTSLSNEISTVNDKITTISTAHDNLAGSVGVVRSGLKTAVDKLNTIQEGAEPNKINAIQLNGNPIQPIDKTVNLTNIVVNAKLDSVIRELNSSFDTKLNTLKAETDGATDALTQNVGDINNTLDSKLDISVAATISGDLSSAIRSVSAVVDKNKTDFDKKLNDINVSVLFNKDYIDKLATADTAISNKIDSVSSELMGFIKGKVDYLDDELKDKVSRGDFDYKVDDLDKKDNELADELTKQESHIDSLKSEIDRHSRKLEDTITEIFVTSTNSTLRPRNGVISIDVATTSIINAQISAMADVFHVTVDELVEHFNEDLSVISTALDAKTDISTFNIVSTNVDSLKAVVSDHTQKIDTLKAELNDLSIHTDELHQNSIALINELSTKHIKEIENEANICREADRNLEIVIKEAINERNDLLKIEKDERVKTDDELKTAIKDLTVNLDGEIQRHTADVISLKAKDEELKEKIGAEISDRKNAITDLTTNFDSKLASFNERIITCETIVEQNRELYKTHDEQITGLLTTTATNTANIESLTARLKDHSEAGSKRFDEINGKLDELEVAIYGDKSGGNGLADRMATAEKEITGLASDLKDTQSKLDKNSDDIDTISDAIYGNSDNEPGLLKVVDNLIDKVLGDGGLSSQVTKVTDRVDIHRDLISTNQKNIAELITAINGNNEEAGLADKLSSLSDAVLNGDTSLSSRIVSLEASSNSHTDLLDNISDTLYGNPDDSSDNGLTAVVDKLIGHVFGENGKNGLEDRLTLAENNIGELRTTTKSITTNLTDLSSSITATGGLSSQVIGNTNNITTILTDVTGIFERLNDINNDLRGNHRDNPDIFGVHDRIEDLENSVKTISDLEDKLAELDSKLDGDIDELQLSATAVVEKITSVSKDLDETRGWVNNLSETTKKVYEAVYGDGNSLNGLDNIVDELSYNINTINGVIAGHTERIEELEKNTVDFSPIYDRLDEVDSSLSALSAENDNLLIAVDTAINSIESLNDRINKIETNTADLSSINGRLDDLETENSQLLEAVTTTQNAIETLNDNLDENIEAGISDIFVAAIGNLLDDNLVDDKYQIKEIDPIGSATINDIVKRLNAIIKIINDVAK